MRKLIFFLSTIPFSLLALLEIDAGAERRLSLAEAVRLAGQDNTELHLEEIKVLEARQRQKGTRGLYGPKLMAEANILFWDSAQSFQLTLPDMSNMQLGPEALQGLGLTIEETGTLLKYQDLMSLVPKLLPAFAENLDLGTIRDQLTAQIQLTLAQPLTPLLQIHSGYRATAHLTESAALDLDAKRVEVIHKVREAYLRLMQVQRLAEVARTGVAQVEEHLKRARQFNAAGLIGKQEVLKAQLELARAKERVIKARYGASMASSALAVLLGLSLDEPIVPTEVVRDPPPPLALGLADCLRRAREHRAEHRSLEEKHHAALADKRRTGWDLLPQISAVATYQYTEGQSTFMPKNAFFVGGILKWELWDWGNKYYALQAAGTRARQAELGMKLLRDGIDLQTKKAFLDLKQSEEALGVARVAIDEAEENFRIEQRRFEANANTSTDVLDAQLALTRAQLSYTSALYGHYIARAALQRAMGDDRL